MTTMTIAGFARLQNVSRKTVYEWKARDYLAFDGKAVDVERSNTRLAAAGLSRLKPDNLRRQVSRQLRQRDTSVVASAEMMRRHALQFPTVLAMATFADCVGDLALDLLAHLPAETVRALMDRTVERNRKAAIEMAFHDGDGPPAGLTSWADHPWFTRPAMADADWQELEEEHLRRGSAA
jgi:hypothetical protein